MICSPGTTPTCEPTSKTCRKCVTGCGRTKGLAPARGTVWSTNLVTLAVYVHRIPCRCSSGAHREGTMLVPNMGHDVGNPYRYPLRVPGYIHRVSRHYDNHQCFNCERDRLYRSRITQATVTTSSIHCDVGYSAQCRWQAIERGLSTIWS